MSVQGGYRQLANQDPEDPQIDLGGQSYSVLSEVKAVPTTCGKVLEVWDKIYQGVDDVFSGARWIGGGAAIYGTYYLLGQPDIEFVQDLGDGGAYILTGLKVAAIGFFGTGAFKLLRVPIHYRPDRKIYILKQVKES